jgi:regulator of replication initiation timing
MKVAHSRDADQKKMMRDLINENTTLRVENNNLKQQVSELTEMINGTPV